MAYNESALNTLSASHFNSTTVTASLLNMTTVEVRLTCDRGGVTTSYTGTQTLALYAAIALLSAVTVAGNTLVVAAFAVDRKLRSFGNCFILNLAASDLVVGLLIAVYAPYAVRGCWQLTRAGCLAFLLLDYVVPLASAWNMALISLDRYCSVAWPIDYRRVTVSTSSLQPRAAALMLVPWLVGTAWYAPTVLFWRSYVPRSAGAVSEHDCHVDFFDHAPYLVASSCVEFVAPFVTVASINVLIYVNIRRRSRLLAASSTPASSAGGSRSRTKGGVQLRRDKRSARSLAILVVAFLVTWAPYEVCAFANPVCGFCIPASTFEVAFWLLWINSTINPMLYPFVQRRFRVAFARLLCRGRHVPVRQARASAASASTTTDVFTRRRRRPARTDDDDDYDEDQSTCDGATSSAAQCTAMTSF